MWPCSRSSLFLSVGIEAHDSSFEGGWYGAQIFAHLYRYYCTRRWKGHVHPKTLVSRRFLIIYRALERKCLRDINTVVLCSDCCTNATSSISIVCSESMSLSVVALATNLLWRNNRQPCIIQNRTWFCLLFWHWAVETRYSIRGIDIWEREEEL